MKGDPHDSGVVEPLAEHVERSDVTHPLPHERRRDARAQVFGHEAVQRLECAVAIVVHVVALFALVQEMSCVNEIRSSIP